MQLFATARVLAAALAVLASGTAMSAGFQCALKHPKPQATGSTQSLYPPVYVRRVDYADTAADAECLLLELEGVIPTRENCGVPGKAQMVRCLPAAPDPVVDPLPRLGGAGVEGATGPTQPYRCVMAIPGKGSYRMVTHTLLSAGSWADVDRVRVATGARNEVNRGACLPAQTYDQLHRLLGAEPPPSPFAASALQGEAAPGAASTRSPATPPQAGLGACADAARACVSGCDERKRALVDTALDAAVCKTACERTQQVCTVQPGAAAAAGGMVVAGPAAPAPQPASASAAAKPSRAQTAANDLAERLKRTLNRP